MAPGDVVLLENIRFHPEEEKNDPAFARQLADLADLYVNDAFGTVHRAHASTEGVAHLLPAYAGLLVEKEVEALSRVLNEPAQPLVIVMGGAKISDKIEVLDNLLPRAARVLIGGAMANTFLGAASLPVGASQVEPHPNETAPRLQEDADNRGVMLLTPVDFVVTDDIKAPARVDTRLAHEIEPGDVIADIGPKTVETYSDAIGDARTVFWNGPMGVFEREQFAAGTLGVANALAGVYETAYTVVGGGESVEAVNRSGVAPRIHHISTGGGASLEFIGGRSLPGLTVLEER
jgi:phosphoglycerate kinase